MTNQELIARYLYAATNDLPDKMRDDVAMELQGLIEDMLAERYGDTAPTTAQLKEVLAEIGRPGEVYARYSPDGTRALIGPPYFAKYKLVLRLVVYCVALALLVLGAFKLFASGDGLGEAIFGWVGTVVNGVVFAFASVTIIFAIMQWQNVPLGSLGSSLDDLPPVPRKRQRISRVECVVEIVAVVVLTAVLLWFPEVLRFYHMGTAIPVFNLTLLQSRWPILVLGALVEIAAACYKLFEGRYSYRFALVNLAFNLAGGLCGFLLLGGEGLMSPEFLSVIGSYVESEAGLYMFTHLNTIILAALLLGLAVDSVTAFAKAAKITD